MLRRKNAKLAELGLTEAEYEEQRMNQKKTKRTATLKGGLTEDGRRRISESVKKRWENPEFREWYSSAVKGQRNHSDETRARISKAIAVKWTDVDYRRRAIAKPSDEIRAKISATLKLRWEDPEFRQKMTNHSYTRSEAWKVVVSQKIKKKWSDPVYRSKVEDSLRSKFNSTNSRPERVYDRIARQQRRQEMLAAHKLAKEEKKEKVRLKKEAIKTLQECKNSKVQGLSLKELLGSDLWMEEKVM